MSDTSITLDRALFCKAMNILDRAADHRLSMEILTAVKATVGPQLHLSVSDLDVSLHIDMPIIWRGRNASDRSFLIEDFRRVRSALNAAGGPEVAIDPGAGKADAKAALAIAAGAMAFTRHNSFAVAEYPDCTTEPENIVAVARLSADHIAQIARVTAAISTEETRYYLNGVYIHHVDGWNWRAVATDGHRLMVAELAVPDLDLPGGGFILPRKAVRLLVDWLGKSRGGVTMDIGDGRFPRVSLTGECLGLATAMHSKTIDGKYPDYSKVMALRAEWSILTTATALRQAIQAVSSLFSVTPSIALCVRDGDILVEAADVPEMTARFTVEGKTAQINGTMPGDFRIGFNGRFLMDCLKALRGQDVVISGSGVGDPVGISDPADPAFCSILMPLRLSQGSMGK